MSDWTPLKNGEAVTLQVGYLYHIVANVKTSHSTSDIEAIAARKGLVVDTISEGAASGSYRQVEAYAHATANSTLPWSVPFPLSLFDSSGVTSAWVSTPSTPDAPSDDTATDVLPATQVTAPAPVSPDTTPVRYGSPVAIGVVMAGLGIMSAAGVVGYFRPSWRQPS